MVPHLSFLLFCCGETLHLAALVYIYLTVLSLSLCCSAADLQHCCILHNCGGADDRNGHIAGAASNVSKHTQSGVHCLGSQVMWKSVQFCLTDLTELCR